MLQEFRIAFEIGFRIRKYGLIFGQHGFGLIERGLKRPRIELKEQIAGMNELAFAKRDLRHMTFDAASDRDSIEGLHIAQTTQEERHVTRLRARDEDRYGRRILRLFGCGNKIPEEREGPPIAMPIKPGGTGACEDKEHDKSAKAFSHAKPPMDESFSHQFREFLTSSDGKKEVNSTEYAAGAGFPLKNPLPRQSDLDRL